MESISPNRRSELFRKARSIKKVELADYYAMDEQTFTAWKAGEKVSFDRWRDDLTRMRSERRTWQRLRVVSEPLSEYQRMAVELSIPEEELRWLPRRMVSAIPLPGNDCFIFNDQTVAFNVLDGNGMRVDIQYSDAPEVVRYCLDSFSLAWDLAIPHVEYQR